MSDPTPSEARFRQIQDEMVFAHQCTRGSWFSLLAIKTHGKVFAALWITGEMVFKLQGEAHQQALSLPGASLFQPLPDRRPMKEWVQVPFDHAEQWPALAQIAMDYVQNLAISSKKKNS